MFLYVVTFYHNKLYIHTSSFLSIITSKHNWPTADQERFRKRKRIYTIHSR